MVKFTSKFSKIIAPKETPIMGFKLTTPALIAFIAYIILALVIVLPFEIPITNEYTKEVVIIKYNIKERLIALLLLLVPTALSIYTINCMIAGKCVVWTYVVSIVSVFWVILFVTSALIYTFNKTKKDKYEKFTENIMDKMRNAVGHVAQDTQQAATMGIDLSDLRNALQ